MDEIELGTQVTSPFGAGIVQWIDGPIITVKIYHETGVRQLARDSVDFWPPRKASGEGDRG